jgi:hypothetical protein
MTCGGCEAAVVKLMNKFEDVESFKADWKQ